MGEFPTSFDQKTLEDYLMYLVRILIAFGIAASVVSFVLVIARCCIFKPGNKKRDKYGISEKISACSRTAYVILAAAALAVAIISCSVGWAHNNKFHSEFVKSMDTTDDVIIYTDIIVLSLNDTVEGVKTDLDVQVDNAIVLVSNLTYLLDPVTYALGTLPNATDDVNEMIEITTDLSTNITQANAELDYLRQYEEEGVLEGVPPPFPDMTNSVLQPLEDSALDLEEITINIENVTNDVNDTINELSAVQIQNLEDATAEYESQADDLSSFLTDTHGSISDVHSSYQTFSDDGEKYSNIRKIVIAVILIIPIVATGMGLVGVLFKFSLLLKIAAWFGVTFLFFYVNGAAINYIVYQATTDFCNDQDDVVVAAANEFGSNNMTIPGLNHTVTLAEKIPLILKCAGETNLVDIFEAQYIIDQLNVKVREEADAVVDEANQLNVSDEYDETNYYIDQYLNQTVDLDLYQGYNVTAVQMQLDSLNEQLTDLSRFNFSEAAYNSSLQAVNNITTNFTTLSGLHYNYYYDSNNVTNLDCTAYPYSDSDDQTQDDLCAKADVAISMTNTRNEILNETAQISATIDSLNQQLAGFVDAVERMQEIQQELDATMEGVRDAVNDSYNQALLVINEAVDITNAIVYLVGNGTYNMVYSTHCEYIGNAYSSLTNSLCDVIRPTLQVIAAMMLIGAATMAFGSIIYWSFIVKIT